MPIREISKTHDLSSSFAAPFVGDVRGSYGYLLQSIRTRMLRIKDQVVLA